MAVDLPLLAVNIAGVAEEYFNLFFIIENQVIIAGNYKNVKNYFYIFANLLFLLSNYKN